MSNLLQIGLLPIIRRPLRYFTYFAIVLALAIALIGFRIIDDVINLKHSENQNLLIGGDVRVEIGFREFDADELAFIDARAKKRTLSNAYRSMVSRIAEDGPLAKLSYVRAVDDFYPLVGAIETEPSLDMLNALDKRQGRFGAILARDLVAFLDLTPGDLIRIGDIEYEFRATLVATPDLPSLSEFALPTAIIHRDALTAASNDARSPLARNIMQIELNDAQTLENFTTDAERGFGDRSWELTAAENASTESFSIGSFARSTIAFANLLVVALYAVALTVLIYIQLEDHKNTDKLLKELGARPALRLGAPVSRLCVFVVLSLAIALPISRALYLTVETAVRGQGFQVTFNAARFGAIYIQAAMLFISLNALALWFAWQHIYKPSSRFIWLTGIVVILGFGASFAWVYAPLNALVVPILVIIAILIFYVAIARMTKWLLRKSIPMHWRFAPSLGIFSATRSRHEFIGALYFMVILLLYFAFIIGAGMRDLRSAIVNSPINASHYIADLLPEQLTQFEARFATTPLMIDEVWPVARVRFGADGNDDHWLFRGDRVVAFFEQAPPSLEIVEGNWWTSTDRDPVLAIDLDIATETGLAIGDKLRVSTLQSSLEVEIVAITKRNPTPSTIYLPLVFNDSAREAFNHSYVVAAQVAPEFEGDFYRAINEKFGNAIIISTEGTKRRIIALFGELISAMNAIAWIFVAAIATALASVFVLYERKSVYEIAIFNWLGASRHYIAGTRMLHFGIHFVLTLGTVILIDKWVTTRLLAEFYRDLSPDALQFATIFAAIAAITILAIPVLLALILPNSGQIDRLAQNFRGDTLD